MEQQLTSTIVSIEPLQQGGLEVGLSRGQHSHVGVQVIN